MQIRHLLQVVSTAIAVSACQTATHQPDQASPSKPSEHHLLSEDEKAQVRRGIIATLKDPGSARFSDTFAAAKDADGVITVCGYVNAKNSFGGYTGDQPFIGVMTTANFVPVGFGATEAERAVTLKLCRSQGVIG